MEEGAKKRFENIYHPLGGVGIDSYKNSQFQSESFDELSSTMLKLPPKSLSNKDENTLIQLFPCGHFISRRCFYVLVIRNF